MRSASVSAGWMRARMLAVISAVYQPRANAVVTFKTQTPPQAKQSNPPARKQAQPRRLPNSPTTDAVTMATPFVATSAAE